MSNPFGSQGSGTTVDDIRHCVNTTWEAYKLNHFEIFHKGRMKKRGKFLAGWKRRWFVVVPPGYLFYFASQSHQEKFMQTTLQRDRYKSAKFVEALRLLVLGSCPFVATPDELEPIASYKGERHVLTVKINAGPAHRRFYFACESELELTRLHESLKNIQKWDSKFNDTKNRELKDKSEHKEHKAKKARPKVKLDEKSERNGASADQSSVSNGIEGKQAEENSYSDADDDENIPDRRQSVPEPYHEKPDLRERAVTTLPPKHFQRSNRVPIDEEFQNYEAIEAEGGGANKGAGTVDRDIKITLMHHFSLYQLKLFHIFKEGVFKKKGRNIAQGWKQRYFVIVPPGVLFYFQNRQDLEKFKVLMLHKDNYTDIKLVNTIKRLILGSCPVYDKKMPSRLEALSKYKGENNVLEVTITNEAGQNVRSFYFASRTEQERIEIHDALEEVTSWGDEFLKNTEHFEDVQQLRTDQDTKYETITKKMMEDEMKRQEDVKNQRREALMQIDAAFSDVFGDDSTEPSQTTRKPKRKNEIIGFSGGSGTTEFDLKNCTRHHLRCYKLKHYEVVHSGWMKKRGRFMAGWKRRKYAVVPPGYIYYFAKQEDLDKFKELEITEENYKSIMFREEVRELVLGSCPIVEAPKEMRVMSRYKGETNILTLKISTDDAHRRFYFAFNTKEEATALKDACNAIPDWGENYIAAHPGLTLELEDSSDEYESDTSGRENTPRGGGKRDQRPSGAKLGEIENLLNNYSAVTDTKASYRDRMSSVSSSSSTYSDRMKSLKENGKRQKSGSTRSSRSSSVASNTSSGSRRLSTMSAEQKEQSKRQKVKIKPRLKKSNKQKQKSQKRDFDAERRKKDKAESPAGGEEDTMALHLWKVLQKKFPNAKKEHYYDADKGWDRRKLRDGVLANQPPSTARQAMRSKIKDLMGNQRVVRTRADEEDEVFENLKNRMERVLEFDRDNLADDEDLNESEDEKSDDDDLVVPTTPMHKSSQSSHHRGNTYLGLLSIRHDVVDESFEGVAELESLFIWKLDGFTVEMLDEELYGKFHVGEAYVILSPQEDDTDGEVGHDVFYWVGEEAPVDKPCIAAIKAIELVRALGAGARLHREYQNAESDRFNDIFDQIEYLPGGGETALNPVESDEEVFIPTLLHLKGDPRVVMHCVGLESSSLNSGDVFILDTYTAIYVWVGKYANFHERAKGPEFAQTLKESRITRHSSDCKIVCINEPGDLKDDSVMCQDEEKEFWNQLGGQKDINSAAGGGADRSVMDIVQVLELSNNDDEIQIDELDIEKGKMYEEYLINDKVYVMDCENELFVWVGSNASKMLKEGAVAYSAEVIEQTNRPDWTPLQVMVQHAETPLFKSKFEDWEPLRFPKYIPSKYDPESIPKIQSIDRVDMASLHSEEKQQELVDLYREGIPQSGSDSVENFPKPRKINDDDEEPEEQKDQEDFTLYEEEELYVYLVTQDNALEEASSDGFFFSDKAYICMHSYAIGDADPEDLDDEDEETEDGQSRLSKIEKALRQRIWSTVYFWQGTDCPYVSFTTWKYELKSTVQDFLKERTGTIPNVVAVQQGREPDRFLRLFDEGIIVLKGRSPSEESRRELDPSLPASDFSDHFCQLFHIHGFEEISINGVQIECVSRNLNSGDVFTLLTPEKVYAWYGKQCPELLRDIIIGILDRLMGERELELVNEGEEPENFWAFFKTVCQVCKCNRFAANKFRQNMCTNCLHRHRPPDYKEDYGEMKEKTKMFDQPARLFNCTTTFGIFRVEEIPYYCQDDLRNDRVMILDTTDRLFMWSGLRSVAGDRDLARDFAAKYIKTATDGRNIESCGVIEEIEEEESGLFRSFFQGWNEHLEPQFQDPYQPKQEALEDLGLVGTVVNYKIQPDLHVQIEEERKAEVERQRRQELTRRRRDTESASHPPNTSSSSSTKPKRRARVAQIDDDVCL